LGCNGQEGGDPKPPNANVISGGEGLWVPGKKIFLKGFPKRVLSKSFRGTHTKGQGELFRVFSPRWGNLGSSLLGFNTGGFADNNLGGELFLPFS